MEGTGYERRTPPRGELSHAKQQVAAPADLLAEEDDRENDHGYGEVENARPKPGPRPEKRTTPKAAATPKLTAMITAGPRTAMSSPGPSAG